MFQRERNSPRSNVFKASLASLFKKKKTKQKTEFKEKKEKKDTENMSSIKASRIRNLDVFYQLNYLSFTMLLKGRQILLINPSI